MSWKSQQGYTLGFLLNEPTAVVAGIASSLNTLIYTSPPLPAGVWLVTINGIGLTGSITQALLGAFVDGNPIANCGMLTDISVFPSLVFLVGSNGATVLDINVDCDTSVGTWDVDAGLVQLSRLTTYIN